MNGDTSGSSRRRGVSARRVRLLGTWWAAFGLFVTLAVLMVRSWSVAETSETLSSAGRHVTGEVRYEESPPTVGDHHPVWWDCGRYDRPVPAEHALHSMEHGAVWITYRPDVAPSVLTALRDAADRDYIILSPLPQQDSPIVVSAWMAQRRVAVHDLEQVRAFIVTHRLSPRAPESGGLCTNGTTRDLVERG